MTRRAKQGYIFCGYLRPLPKERSPRALGARPCIRVYTSIKLLHGPDVEAIAPRQPLRENGARFPGRAGKIPGNPAGLTAVQPVKARIPAFEFHSLWRLWQVCLGGFIFYRQGPAFPRGE